MTMIRDNKTLKVSSRGRVVIPLDFRKRMHLSSGDQLEMTLSDDGRLLLEKLPSNSDWKKLIADIPVEQVTVEQDGRYDPVKSPNFDKWMHEE